MSNEPATYGSPFVQWGQHLGAILAEGASTVLPTKRFHALRSPLPPEDATLHCACCSRQPHLCSHGQPCEGN